MLIAAPDKVPGRREGGEEIPSRPRFLAGTAVWDPVSKLRSNQHSSELLPWPRSDRRPEQPFAAKTATRISLTPSALSSLQDPLSASTWQHDPQGRPLGTVPPRYPFVIAPRH